MNENQTDLDEHLHIILYAYQIIYKFLHATHYFNYWMDFIFWHLEYLFPSLTCIEIFMEPTTILTFKNIDLEKLDENMENTTIHIRKIRKSCLLGTKP